MLGLTFEFEKDAARRIGARRVATAVDEFGRRSRGAPNSFERRVIQNLPEWRLGHPFGRGRDQRRPGDPAAIVLRELPGMRQHRHPAHRMADQHDRAPRRDHLQHGLQVLAQLCHRVGFRRGFTGPAVTALVIEDHSNLGSPFLGQPDALKVKGAHAKAESVGEHDGQWCVGGPHLAHREGHAVGSGHQIAAVTVECLEILVGIGIVEDGTPSHRAGHSDSGDGAERTHSCSTCQPPCQPLVYVGAVNIVTAQRFPASR